MSGLLTLVERELVRFYRQRSRVVGALLTPLLFWLFIGAGLGESFNPQSSTGGMNFREYFFPGTLVLIVFFTAIFSTISVIEDRREGFMQSVLVSPASRLSLAGGKIIGGALLAVMQGVVFLALAPLAGIPLSAWSVAVTLGALGLVALGLTGLGFIIAWQMDSTQGFHAIMNVFLIPLWLLSGAAFPASGASPWLRTGMAANPVSYGVALVRRALYAGRDVAWPDVAPLLPAILVTASFAALTLSVSSWVIRKRTVIQ
jgi:ABC-2 type transport system permease protein